MEIAISMRDLMDNLTNFYSVLEKTAEAASIIYQHKILAVRLHSLEADHMEMLYDLRKYFNSFANVKHTSSLPSRLLNQGLTQDSQPHPVISFKPKPLFQRFGP